MIFKDYYKILGLENTRVSSDEIKIAFREQAKKYHPDVNTGSASTEERFKDINEAYRVLSSSSSKRKYDRMWNHHVGKRQSNSEEGKREKGSVANDFFSMFFGTPLENNNEETKTVKKKVPVKGENVETEISVGIEDAYFGTEKKISLRTVAGKMKTFSVKIPSGIRDGKNGDMFIKININESEKFKLKGYDIVTDLFLTPWEAALGKRVNIDSIDDTVSLYVPPGIQSGEKVRIPQKGYKDGKGGRGDLIAEVKTVVPKKLTEDEKELFEKLKAISEFNPRRK